MRTFSAVMGRAPRLRRVPLGTGTLALLAFALTCEDVTVTPVAVRDVAVTPTDTTLTVGDELKLTAVVRDDAGNRLKDRAVAWSSENDDVVSVDGAGGIIAVGSGEADVTAAVDGRSGTATIHVTEPEEEQVDSIEVRPPETQIAVGQSIQLEAIARSEDGTVLEGRTVSWSSGDESVAAVNGKGTVTGESAGEATITATIGDVEGTATVTVTEEVEPVESVEVVPADTTINVGATVTLEAVAKSEDGAVLGGHDVSWSSDDEDIATVNDEGVVTGQGPGETTIEATIEGVSDAAKVTVSLEAVDSVAIDPPEPNVRVGGTVQLEATAFDEDGEPLQGREVEEWKSGDEAIATVDAQGQVTGHSVGEAMISATIEGVAGTVEVTVSLIPVDSVAIEPPDTSIFVSDTVQLTATAFDEDGEPLQGRDVEEWRSSDEAVATVDAQGQVTGHGVGEAEISAMIEDMEGAATVTVGEMPVDSVDIVPADTTIVVGETVELTATALSASGDPLDGRNAEWSTSNPDIATVDEASGEVTGVAEGTVKITAEIEGKQGTADVTVDPEPIASIDIAPVDTTLAEGDSATLHAVLTGENGSDLTDRELTWESTDASIAAVTGTGTYQLDAKVTAGSCELGQLSCNATITATAEGVQGTATVTVEKLPATVAITVDGTAPQTPIELLADSTIQLDAQVQASDGTPFDDVPIEWETSDASAATVNDGLVTGVGTCTSTTGECTATISATADGISDSVDVVVPRPVAMIDVQPSSDTVRLAILPRDVPFSATLSAADTSTPLPGRTVAWKWTSDPNAHPCSGISPSGNPSIDLQPPNGVTDDRGMVSTTAQIPLVSPASVVVIWAEAEEEVGCATLHIQPLL